MTRMVRGMLAAATAACLVAACGPARNDEPIPAKQGRSGRAKPAIGESITGGGISGLFADEQEGPVPGTGIGVNTYLWRAALDTVSFMPLTQADPFGGVIITDWHSPNGVDGERIKVNVFILGRQLRANALRTTVFRQVRKNGEWVDAEVTDKTVTRLENAILSRARELRVARRKQQG